MKACPPTATYRLQFHHGFTFADARAIVPYLHRLGISHIYASPIFRAMPGSIHGYDICDHNELNPELGGRAEFDALLGCLRQHGMGMILDFVPNHMGIAKADNAWWMGVLEDGPSSPYARYFDIDWSPLKMEMANKVLLAILDDQYGRVLERGDLRLAFQNGSFHILYQDRHLPTAPRSIIPLLRRVLESLPPGPQAELESILYALEHLPENHETDAQRIREKAREKDLLKQRLLTLCHESAPVQNGIERVIRDHYTVREGGSPENADALDALIHAQSYRLAYWRVASEEINYRRFFDVNDLAALRMHLPEVFENTHRLLLELLASDVIQGVRIDHIDGLCDPCAYLQRLQESYARLTGGTAADKPLYLLVEKILGHGEELRREWPVHGTTGYEFAAQVMNQLVQPDHEQALTRVYQKFTGITAPFSEHIYRGKSLVMRTSMPSEVNMLAHLLHHLSQTNRWYRDFTLNSLENALQEVIACFPVYRSYITAGSPASAEDHRLILRAIASARRRNPDMERTVFEFIRDVLIPPPNHTHPVDEEARQEFVLRFQQSTGPITAKGVEDTAFYVYNRLACLNEVGGEPGLFGTKAEVFHQENERRLQQHPASLLATSTHDTKRSEDVRCRLAVLSEMPSDWGRMIRHWQRLNKKHRVPVDEDLAPDANEEYLLYQSLLGTWPLEPMDAAQREDYLKRISHYMVKAMHEAKVNTSWIEPNLDWDQAVGRFVHRILAEGKNPVFEQQLSAFAQRLAGAGALNSLAQTALKLTCPGVPDIYQGQELWDYSLVDPDNRRPVHYEERQRLLDALDAPPAELLAHWQDGRLKLLVTHRLLTLRREHPQLFLQGSYTPLYAQGSHAGHVLAFQRSLGKHTLEVIVPRLTAKLPFPALGHVWGDTRLTLAPGKRRTHLLTRQPVPPEGGSPRLSQLFADLPLAVHWVESE